MLVDRIWFRIVLFIRRRRIRNRFDGWMEKWPPGVRFKAGDKFTVKNIEGLEDGDYIVTGEYGGSLKIEKKECKCPVCRD